MGVQMCTGYSVLLAPTAANILETKSHCISQKRLLCRMNLEGFANGGGSMPQWAHSYLNWNHVQFYTPVAPLTTRSCNRILGAESERKSNQRTVLMN